MRLSSQYIRLHLLGLNEYVDTPRNQRVDQQVHAELLPIGTDHISVYVYMEGSGGPALNQHLLVFLRKTWGDLFED